jgi:flagellar basal-body rod protein FlgB
MGFRLDPLVDRLDTVLDLRQQQHTLTATNLANADTPGYRAQVLDFDTALLDAMDVGTGPRLDTAQAGHIAGIGSADAPEIVELEAPPWSEDGNSVFAERESARMVSNQLVYTGVATGLARHLALLRYAASDGRG